MNIEAVDFFYLSMPVVRDIGDGSQDALLVRVASDTGLVGWGECEAAPLPSIAAWCCPMSHSACKPVAASVIGQRRAMQEAIACEDYEHAQKIRDSIRAIEARWLGADQG